MAKEDIQRLYSGDLHGQPKDIDDILATGPERGWLSRTTLRFLVCVPGEREMTFSEAEMTGTEPGLGEARPQFVRTC